MTDPVVSIICETYNHEDYLAQCLDALLAQETRHAFEIIIHDDASTDGTAAIAEKYIRDHPGIIHGILQQENQLSQGRNPFDLACEIAKGTYIACCEGDDFWLDPRKLEIQVAYLEEHPSCTFCFTNAQFYDDAAQAFSGTMLPGTPYEKEHLVDGSDLGVEEILQVEFIPTASFIFPRWAYDRRPIFPLPAYDGDRYMQMVMTQAGYAHFIDIESVAYRINNGQSMMASWRRDNAKMYETDLGFAHLYRDFNDFTGKKYHEILDPYILRWEYAAARHSGVARNVRQARFWHHAQSRGLPETAVYLVTCISPTLFLKARTIVRSLPRLGRPKLKTLKN